MLNLKVPDMPLRRGLIKAKRALDRFTHLRAKKEPVADLILCDGATIDLMAAGENDDAPKRFEGVAYSGGTMRPSGMGGDVVVDLSGVTIVAGDRPILHNHDDTRIVGHSDNIQINAASGITVQGVVSGAGQAASEVLASSRNGFPWRLSIGARILKRERLEAGATAIVNGRTFHGPMQIVRKATIHEISFVAVPGDFGTSVSIAATQTKESNTMEFNEWLTAKGFDPENLVEQQETFLRASFDSEMAMKAEDAKRKADEAKKETIKASLDKAGDTEGQENEVDPTVELRAKHASEVTRLGKLATACKDFPDLHAKAITENWDTDKAELEVLKANLDKAPNFHVRQDEERPNNVLEAALCTAGGLADVEKQYDDKTLQAAHTTYGGNISIRDLLLQAARDNGFSCRGYAGNEKDILRAAFSTTSLPGIFSNTANKFLLAGFNHIESSWRRISAIGSVSDFKQVTKYRLTGDMTYEQLAPTGEIKHAQVDEESFTNQAVTYARMFGITRVDIINDDLNALSAVPTKIGMGAARVINNKFWAEFMDNSAFFTAARNNRETGAGSALSISALTAAELAFLDQVDPDSLPLGIEPKIMLVPNALWVTAGQIHSDLQVRDESSGAGTKKFPTGNPHAGKYDPVRSSFLGNTSITGNSTTAWYLLADPAELATIEVVFLNGKQVPTTDTAEADFNQLGIQMRGYIDFGVNKQEFRAGVANDGA